MPAVAIFLALEALCFNSSVYPSLLKPDAPPGQLCRALESEEKMRVSAPVEPGRRRVLVLGDSRMAEGFSARAADAHTADRGISFGAACVHGSTLRTWYYTIRELDPDGSHYAAVVLPFAFYGDHAYYPDPQDLTSDLTLLAPVLRYTDVVDVVASFTGEDRRFEALRATLLKGYALRGDFQGFLRKPGRRLRELERADEEWRVGRVEYEGNPGTLAGLEMSGGRIRFRGESAGQSPFLRNKLREELAKTPTAQGSPAYRREWLGRIAALCRAGGAKLIAVRPPRAPIIILDEVPTGGSSAIRELEAAGRLVTIEESLFEDLERPELFFDGRHLNMEGRRIFTRRLALAVADLLPPR